MALTKKQIMNRIYQDICGFEIPKQDEKNVRNSKGSPVYGEITLTSTKKLFDHIKLKSDDIFFDLGSGVGKVIMYAGLFTPVKLAIGIELSKTRHNDSLLALRRACDYEKNLTVRCQFKNADILTQDLSQASVVYTCSTAFSQDFMRKLTTHLSNFSHDYRLITLQDLPNERHFELVDQLRFNMSWQRATPIYIYRRRQ